MPMKKKSFVGQGKAATVSAQLKKVQKVKQGFVGQGTAAVLTLRTGK